LDSSQYLSLYQALSQTEPDASTVAAFCDVVVVNGVVVVAVVVVIIVVAGFDPTGSGSLHGLGVQEHSPLSNKKKI
jgi:hypothetical protein